MHFTTLLPLVAALPSTLAFPGFHSHQANKRAYAANDVTLYAYGTNISGFPLLYGANDGKSIHSSPIFSSPWCYTSPM